MIGLMIGFAAGVIVTGVLSIVMVGYGLWRAERDTALYGPRRSR